MFLDLKYIEKIRSKLHNKVKFMKIEDILTIIILNLSELKRTNQNDPKQFLDNEIFPSLKLILIQPSTKPKHIITIMKFLTNYQSDYIINEFLPFFFTILKQKGIFEKAEDVVNALNFIDFYEKKFPVLLDKITEIKLFLSENYFGADNFKKKIEQK